METIIFTLFFKWKYQLAQVKARWSKEKTPKKIKSVTYVAREADKDWIFGAKVRRLSKYSTLQAATYFHNGLRNLPKTDGYYFIFPNYFCRAIRHNPHILNKKNIVMFTHPSWSKSYSKTHIAWCLNKAHRVICLNSEVKKELIQIGVKEALIEVIHIASDPHFFYHHQRNSGAVGFCCGYSERKNPDLLFDIVKNMPEKHFYLIGRHWQEYERYKELISFSNFTYFDDKEYKEFPKLYEKFDTFVSTSFLEGGPVPLLEAMLSNCVPVVSKTGFCTDVVKHNKNGFLFNTNASYQEVIELIKKADQLQINIRETAMPYSWENCSKKIDQLYNED